MILKNIQGYRLNIRASVRSLWNGNFDYYQFIDNMSLAIERGFTQSWYEGAALFGIKPNELTDDERNALRAEVAKERRFITPLAQAIVANSKINGGKLEPLFARAELWVSAYNRVRVLASSYAGRDRKMLWARGRTKISCQDCIRYTGKVHRMSVWRKYGALPQSYQLTCRGYKCQCSLSPTDLPANSGHPARPRGG
jgi:hypothetical protein